jgi:hypothetical protein
LLFEMGNLGLQGPTLLIEQCLAVGFLPFKLAQIPGEFLKSLFICVGYCARRMMSVQQTLQIPRAYPQRLRDRANRDGESTTREGQVNFRL